MYAMCPMDQSSGCTGLYFWGLFLMHRDPHLAHRLGLFFVTDGWVHVAEINPKTSKTSGAYGLAIPQRLNGNRAQRWNAGGSWH